VDGLDAVDGPDRTFEARPGARLELRSGVAGEQVVDVAMAEQVDLIALGWSQRLDAGRARTVRRTVTEASVPVMLVPLFTDQHEVRRAR
jgi:nucleotide-binding universal stress UspA family protein